MTNEWFAKDTSRKVKNSLAAKFEAGERVSAYAPLGYKKHPDVKNKLVIDEETSWIIRRIYTLAFYGAGAAKITRTLTQEKIPTPGWLNYQRDGTFANIYRDAPEEKRYAWTIAQVKSILKDETYIGNTIHYRETNISYKNKKRIRKPQSEWMRVEGTQEAIISKEDFERVQQQIASRRRKQKNATTQIFAGLVRCADCGWSMKFATNKQNKIPYSYFSCTCYSQYGTGRCSKHYIRYDTLYAYVLARLQHWTEQVQLNPGQLICELQKSLGGERVVETRRMQNELARVQKRCEEVNRLFARLYEDWTSGAQRHGPGERDEPLTALPACFAGRATARPFLLCEEQKKHTQPAVDKLQGAGWWRTERGTGYDKSIKNKRRDQYDLCG